MTKQDFIVIADALREAKDLAAWCFDNDDDYSMIVAHFCKYLSRTNPRFDWQRFTKHCDKPYTGLSGK